MRSKDIINQLTGKLTSLVDDFTSNISALSLSRAGTTVTVQTDGSHDLAVNDVVNIVGAKTPITILSIDRVGIVATLVTSTAHDITKSLGFENVEIEGANETEFNGTFKLLEVPNRMSIKFEVDDSGPTSATGSPLLINGENIFRTYNGLQKVITVQTTSFKYTISDNTLFTPPRGTIIVKKSPRISASVNYDRAVESYTKQDDGNMWLFVVMGDGTAQKNRNITIDSTDNIQTSQFFNQRINQIFDLYVFIHTTNEIAARQARDRAEELLLPICQSILLTKIDTLLTNKFQNPIQFNNHGFNQYTNVFYVHRYTFESTLQMSFEDTAGVEADVAFRDIDLSTFLNIGTDEKDLQSFIDLDDEPL